MKNAHHIINYYCYYYYRYYYYVCTDRVTAYIRINLFPFFFFIPYQLISLIPSVTSLQLNNS